MPEPQDYINQSRTVGKSDQAIYQELKASGWTDQQLLDHFPTLIAKEAPPQPVAEQKTVASAKKASKRWPMLIGITVVIILVAAIGYAAYQYWLEMGDSGEPMYGEPNQDATPSAQMATDFSSQKASTSALVVYSMTDAETENIKVMSFNLNASASAELYQVSASDSAILTPGYWSPDGRYLPVTIAASQPQMIFFDKYTGKVQNYQAELSNPWEIVPEFVSYWSSGTTAVIDQKDIKSSDNVTKTEISLAGQPTNSEVQQFIKYGGDDYLLDYGLTSTTSADLVLTTSGVPVVLIEDSSFTNPPRQIPVGVTEQAVWLYAIAAIVSDEFNRPATPSAEVSASSIGESMELSSSGMAPSGLEESGASAVNSTMSGVLGVTTPTGLETHLYGYDTTGQGLQYEDVIISTPGWLTSRVVIDPATKTFYIVEYQVLDDSGNGLVQVVNFSSLDEESTRTVLLEFAAQTKALENSIQVPNQFEFTSDGKWFVYRSLSQQTGREQIKAIAVGTGQEMVICESNCGWVSIYNPETPVSR